MVLNVGVRLVPRVALLPMALLLMAADLQLDAEGRVRQDDAIAQQEASIFERIERAQRLAEEPGMDPERVAGLYEEALGILGERDSWLRVRVLHWAAAVYDRAAHAEARALQQEVESILQGEDSFEERMQRVAEAIGIEQRQNRLTAPPDETLVREAIARYEALIPEASGVDRQVAESAAKRAAELRHGLREYTQTHPVISAVPDAAYALHESFEPPVTLETLSRLRAKRAAAKDSFEYLGYLDALLPWVTPMEGTTMGDAIGVIRTAYGIPICVEYDGPQENLPGPFPFRVHEGQRLVDALDSLGPLTHRRAEWRLLEGRVVVGVRGPRAVRTPVWLDREVTLDVHAQTLEAAMLAIETAYNAQHRHGLPMLLDASCLNLLTPPGGSAAPIAPVTIQGTMPLRRAILGLIAAMDEPWMTYWAYVSGRDPQQRHITVSITTRPCRDAFEGSAEWDAFHERMEARRARLQAYFAAMAAAQGD